MLDIPSWFAVMRPAGLPAPVVTRLNSKTANAVARKDVQEQFAHVGTDCSPGERQRN